MKKATAAIAAQMQKLLAAGSVRVPGADRARFLTAFYPALRRALPATVVERVRGGLHRAGGPVAGRAPRRPPGRSRGRGAGAQNPT